MQRVCRVDGKYTFIKRVGAMLTLRDKGRTVTEEE